MTIIKGGKTNYGIPIGILMLDTVFPRIPGDVGNGFTFDFPVYYRKVVGADPKRVCFEGDPRFLGPFIEAAQALEAEGCQAITTSSGFLVMFQRELAEAVKVPVLTSSLLQVPFVQQMLGSTQKVGVLTARKASLTQKHFNGAGIDPTTVVIEGMDDSKAFGDAVIRNLPLLDVETAEAEMIEAAQGLVKNHPEVAAIVLECTNMPPYSKAIRDATGLPVYDVITLIRHTAMAIMAGRFRVKSL